MIRILYIPFALVTLGSAGKAQMPSNFAPGSLSQAVPYQALVARFAQTGGGMVALEAANGSDITGALEAAITANPGKVILLPTGSFTLSRQITITSNSTGIQGRGSGLTYLTCVAPRRDGCVRVYPITLPSGGRISDNSLTGMTLRAAGADTTGTGIRLEQVINFRWTDVNANNFWVGADLAGVSGVLMNGYTCYFGGYATALVPGSRCLRIRAGYSASGAAGKLTSYGVFGSNINLTARNQLTPVLETAMELLALDGGYFSGPNYFGEAQNLIDIKPEGLGTYISNLVFTGGLLDGNARQSANGLRILYNPAAPSVSMSKINVSGLSLSDFTGYGIYVGTASASIVTISSNVIASASGFGVYLAGCSGCTITGNTIGNSGTTGKAASGAIGYTPNATPLTIVGNTIYETNIGASDVYQSGAPTHLQQGFNSTSRSTAVPTVTS